MKYVPPDLRRDQCKNCHKFNPKSVPYKDLCVFCEKEQKDKEKLEKKNKRLKNES